MTSDANNINSFIIWKGNRRWNGPWEKRLDEGAIIVVATLLVYQPQEIIEDYQSMVHSIQDESQKSHAYAGKEANMPPAHVLITLVATIDRDKRFKAKYKLGPCTSSSNGF
ncbi:hypothetical protein [Neobacillus sp. 19]|uniref:hypothetical protein n=1 Tax=Neobacillus sp. 19 TaxID=3394458 RepID=UPI003BF6B3E1